MFMKRFLFVTILITHLQYVNSQENTYYIFDFLIGNWVGSGTGIGKSKSEISASFSYTVGNTYIEVNHHTEFEPSDKRMKGDIHDDWGMISYDKQREVYVYRQFNIEGFYNQFILIDSLTNENIFVFETEQTENVVVGSKTRFTVKKINNFEIETYYDLSLPDKEFANYSRNKLIKEE